MFDYDPPKEKKPTDYTGLIFAAILAPVFLLFIYLGKADMGLTVFIVLGMIMFAVKIRWNLRKHVWFWATIVFILALHIHCFLSFDGRTEMSLRLLIHYQSESQIFWSSWRLLDSQKNSSRKLLLGDVTKRSSVIVAHNLKERSVKDLMKHD